ncbi:MAG TPA: riboflavin synthase [Hyphomicrobiaceae bacterium]
MFTGLIEEVGRLAGVEPTERGLRLSIAANHVVQGLQLGDSVSIDGVCQTVVAVTDGGFIVEAMAPTLSRTTFGGLQPQQALNLERALPLGARMGGHLVQGHVDGVGTVRAVTRQGEHVLVDVEVPAAVSEVTVLHGSIAVNGVSLTVNALPSADVVQVAIIPHTWQHTNFSALRSGSTVNLEGDMIGKYVVEYMKRREINAV